MRKRTWLILALPLFMSVLCEEDEIRCGFEDFEGFDIMVENTQSSYAPDETIWFNASASSMLFNNCEEVGFQVATDPELFRDSFFILQLVNNTEINAEVVDADIIYDLGDPYNFNVCNSSVNIEPVLNANNEEYNFRMGINISESGDYCIVLGRYPFTSFNNGLDINSGIYDAYNNPDNDIKFISCNTTFTRENGSGIYYFKIE